MGNRTAVERTPAGCRLVVSRHVDADPDAVWDLLVDTRRWPDWGPTVTDVACPDRRISAGSTGRVRTVGGAWVPFTVTTCAERRWTWRVGPIPATGHRVDAEGDGCRVAIEVPLLAAAYLPVCGRALRSIERLASDR